MLSKYIAFFILWEGAWLTLAGVGWNNYYFCVQPDSKEQWTKIISRSPTRTIFATCVRAAYYLPKRLFGARIFSLQAFGWSIIVSIAVFFLFLLLAFASSPVDPQTNLSVPDYYLKLALGGSVEAQANSLGFDQSAVKGILKRVRLLSVESSIITVIISFICEFFLLAKSRYILSLVRLDTNSKTIAILFMLDFISSIIIFFSIYPLIWVFVDAILKPNLYPVKLPSIIKQIDNGLPRNIEPQSAREYIEWVWVVYQSSFQDLLDALSLEVKSGFKAFIVLYSHTQEIYLTPRAYEVLRSGDLQAIHNLTTDDLYPPNRTVDIRWSFFPFSTLFSSALFTTIWTSAIIICLLCVRFLGRVSSRFRLVMAKCCEQPELIYIYVIGPSMFIFFAGLVIAMIYFLVE